MSALLVIVRRIAVATALAGCATGLVFAQTPAPTPAPSPSPAATATPGASAGAPTPAAAPIQTNGDTPVAANGEIVVLESRPAATLEGKANRDDIYGAIVGALKTVKAEMDKAGLKAVGRPLAVFLSASDQEFRYRVEIPVEDPGDGKTLGQNVKLGQTPIGKAIRFEHRGAYDDIDGTYDAVTAYVDEKAMDAQDVFIEVYMTDLKSPEDPNAVVNIEVLLK